MKQKVSNYGTKQHLILYKGHTGWKVKTRLFGSLMITLSSVALMEGTANLQAHAATTDTTPAVTATKSTSSTAVTTTKSGAATSTVAASDTKKSAVSASNNSQQSATPAVTSTSQASTTSSQASSATPASSAATSAVSSTATKSTVVANSTASKLTASSTASRASLVRLESANVSTTATTAKYPVLSQDQSVSIGADTTEVKLTADQIAGHFTATVENRGTDDKDVNTTLNTVTQAIGSDGSVSLTSLATHNYYSASGSSSTVQGHQAAHVSFEHEIDFSHNFSMSGAIGIGSKSSGGADSVGFIFAPGDPSKATEGGSGGLLGLGGLSNAFGFVYDEYYNSNYSDPSRSPYIGWRTTDASGNLKSAASTDWKAASKAGLTRSSSPVNSFTMDYNASTKTLTVVLGSGGTFTRQISDTSTGYSISVAASTGGSWNDYSAKIDSFTYTPKTTDITVNLVDSADNDALLNNTDVTAVANIGDTISVFSTQSAADRAVAAGEVEPSLVSVLPTDSAGNVYVVDGAQVTASGHGEVHYVGGDTNKDVADATYYTYTVTDSTSQTMIVPVRLAFTAIVTPVDSTTGEKIPGLDPITVITVAGEPTLVQVPGYTTTKVILDKPADGDAIAYDNLPIDQTNTAPDTTTTTTDTANPIAHYYTGKGTTVDGQTVEVTGVAGTGQSIATNLDKQAYVDASGNAVTSGGQTITNTEYYWSEVGSAGATDSTDVKSPETTDSILLPTTSTLDYWIQQATNYQTTADDYNQQATDIYNKFIALEGLSQANKDAATATFKTITDTYTSVSDSNETAKTAFEKGKTDTATADIYQDGQDGYAALQKVANLLIGFKADLDDLTTTNEEAQNSLATLEPATAVYGQSIPLPGVVFGDGFGNLTAAQIAGMQNSAYFEYYSGSDMTTVVTPKHVGAYVAKLTDAGRAYLKSLNTSNDNIGLFTASTLIITEAAAIAQVNATTATYGGTNSDGTAALTLSGDLGNADTDHTASASDFEIVDGNGTVVLPSQLQAGGDYTIQYTAAAQAALIRDDNYTFTFGTAKLTVKPKTITITAQDHGKTYGTTTDPLLDLTSDSAGGLVNGDKVNSLGVKLVRTAGENAGSYAINLDTANSNLNSNYQITVNSGTFAIAQLPITVNVKDLTKVYGDADPDYSFDLADPETDKLVNGDTVAALKVTLVRDTGENVGSYAITGTSDSDNYQVNINSGTLTVGKRVVTVTADNQRKTYGDVDPKLTLVDVTSVLVNGDTETALGVTLTRLAGENIGSYVITGTSDSSNYAVAIANGTLVISKRAVTVTAADQAKTYGDADPKLTLIDPIGVLVNGDTETALGVTLTRATGENVGSYDIAGTSTSQNYAVTIVNGTFAISKRAVTVTAADQAKTYGDDDPKLTLIDPSAVLVNGDDESALGVSLVRTAGENVGSYDITGTKDSGNYTVTIVNGTFKINKRAVTVTAANQAKTYGDADSKLTLVDPTSVLVNGDAETALGVTLTRVAGENVGVYDITGKSTSQNYDVTINQGSFTIGQRSVTLTADSQRKTYGDTDPQLTWQQTAGSLATTDKLTDLNVSAERVAGEDVDTYAINLSANNDNYAITLEAGQLVINKRSVTVKATDLSKTYGDTDSVLTIDDPTSLLVAGDQKADLGITLQRITGENVGTYTISGVSNSKNYDVTVTAGIFTINKRSVTVQVDDSTKVYGEANPTYTFVIPTNTLVKGDTADTLKVSLSRTSGETVGVYTISGTSDSQNYAVTITAGKLTINRRQVNVIITAGLTKNYGDTDPDLTWQVDSMTPLAEQQTTADLAVTLSRAAGEHKGNYAISGVSANANFNVTFMPQNFTIKQRGVKITLDSPTKVYGDDDPDLTWQLTQGSLPADKTLADLGIVLTREAGNNVGEYGVAVSGSNADYDITVVAGKLTITSRTITVKADHATKTYGDADPDLTWQQTAGSLAITDKLADLNVSAKRIAGENVGTYTINLSADNSNYDIQLDAGQLVINKRSITVKATDLGKIYGNADPVLTIDDPTKLLVTGDEEQNLGIKLQRATGEDVGSYTVTGTSESTNYAVTIINGTFKISKRAVTVTAASQAKTYGDTDAKLTLVDPTGVLVNDDDASALGVTLTRTTGENVGKYAIVGSSDSQNYDVTINQGSFTIGQRAVTLTADKQTKTYGDDDPQLTWQQTGGSLAATDKLADLNVSAKRVAGENVGTYVIELSADNDNYAIKFETSQLVINKRAITVKADGLTKTYGNADSQLTWQQTGGSLAATDHLANLNISAKRVAGENVGSYAINLSANNSNYDIKLEDGQLTIGKRLITVKATDLSKTYGNTDPVLTINDPTSALVTGDQEADLAITLQRTTGENTGDNYRITGTSTSKNYDVTVTAGAFTINKRVVTVQATDLSKTYGNADPDLTLVDPTEVLVNGDTEASLGVTLTRTAGENVGKYDITGISNSTNYDVKINQGTFIIGQRSITLTADNQQKVYGNADPELTWQQTAGSLVATDKLADLNVSVERVADENVGTYAIKLSADNGNYAVKFEDGQLVISKRIITVKAADISKIYGNADPVLTISNPTSVLVTGDQEADLGIILKRTTGENVGDYTITGTGNSKNYDVTVTDGTLRINRRAVTVQAKDVAKVYGNADSAYTLTIPANTLVKGDTADSLKVTLKRTSGENVGTYTIAGTSDSQNYAVTIVDGTFEITKRVVTVTAADKLKTYGNTDSKLTLVDPTAVLVNGDDEAALGVSLIRTVGENVGKYDITGTSDSGNYAVTIVNGDFTISKRAVIVTAANQAKTYGEADQKLTLVDSANVLVSGDDESALGIALTRTAGENVGEYGIVGTSDSENYAVTVVNGRFEINKRVVTVTAANQTKTYGDSDSKLTLIDPTSVLVNGDHASALGVSLTRTTGEHVGTYDITGISNSQNYDVTVNQGMVTIGRRAVTVSAADQAKTYGDADQKLTLVDPTGALVNGDDESALGITLARTAGEDVGTYDIKGNSNSQNYDVKINRGHFTIGQRAVTLTADNQTKTYGNTDSQLTWHQTAGSLAAADKLADLNVNAARVAGENVGTYVIDLSANNSNYVMTLKTGQLVINKRAITVKADRLTKTYGNADPQLTWHQTAGSLAATDKLADLNVSAARIAGENVGTYVINLSANNNNYAMTLETGQLMINKRSIAVKATDLSKTYGNTDSALTINDPTNDLVTGDQATDLGITLQRTTGEDVGSYTIAGTSHSKNYDVMVTAGAFTINKRAVKVQVNDVTKVYGNTDPVYTLTIPANTLVNGDTENALKVSLKRTSGETVGSYTISGTSASQNYEVTITSGNLAIQRRQVNVIITAGLAKTYGDADSRLTWQVDSTTPLAEQQVTTDLAVTLSRDGGEHVGTYAVNGVSGNANFDVTFMPQNFTINRRTGTVTLNNLTKVYGNTDPTLTWQLTQGSLPANKTLADLGLVLTRAAGNDVGEYAITVDDSNPDYDLTVVTSEFKITPRAITVKVSHFAKTYGDKDQALNLAAITTSDALGYHDTEAALRVHLTRQVGETAGNYRITGVGHNKNYAVTVTPADFTIAKRTVTVQAADQTKTYGQADATLRLVAPTGLKAGDSVTALGVRLVRQTGENTGAYTITGVADSKNYVVAILPGKMTITPANAEAEVKDVATTYGEALSFTESLSAGQRAKLVPTDFEIFNTRNQLVSLRGLAAGTYTVQLSASARKKLMAVNPNYDFTTFKAGQLRVAKRQVTIQLGDQTMYAGGHAAQVPATITEGSLVTGETLTDLGLTVDQPDTQKVGDYRLKATIANPNYDAEIVSSELKVLGKTVDAAGNVTITEKDPVGQVVNVTKDWSDHSQTTYVYDPDTSKLTVTETVNHQVTSQQTLTKPEQNVILKDGNGAVTVVNVTDLGSDPSLVHYQVDPDHDGVTSEVELGLGTNPVVADTDGDGFSDGQELQNHTDPLKADSPKTVVQQPQVVQPKAEPVVVKNVSHKTKPQPTTMGPVRPKSLKPLQAQSTKKHAKTTVQTQLPQTDEQSSSLLAALGILLSSVTLAFFRKRH